MYLYLLQHIILWACQQLWLAHAAQKILQLLSAIPLVFPTWHVCQAGQQATSTLAYHLRVERPQQLWLACRLPTWLPSPWLPPPLDTSAQQVTVWMKLSPGLLYRYVCNPLGLAWLVLICLLRFALTSDPNVFRYTSILNYIIVRHWYLLALVNSHLTFSAILWNHRFAIIYTLCMHLSLIMLCLLGFKSAHN